MTTFVQLTNNRVSGFRSGSYEESDIAQNEILVSDVGFNFNEIYGKVLENGNFVADAETQQIRNTYFSTINPNPALVVVPQTITMRQARLALLAASLLDDVDTAINAITDPVQKAAALIEWEYAANVERNSQLIQSLAPALNLTSQQLDDLFTQAAQL